MIIISALALRIKLKISVSANSFIKGAHQRSESGYFLGLKEILFGDYASASQAKTERDDHPSGH